MTGLAPIDGLAVLAIIAKAVEYGAALLASGGVLFAVVFAARADAPVLALARRVAMGAALVGLVVLTLRFGIRAARISGLGIEGALDPVMLGFVWDSPLGTAALWRGFGAAAILGFVLPGVGRWVALGGSVAVALSYTQIGHTLGDPRPLLAPLLVVHLLAVALWVGALLPLWLAARSVNGAALLHHFGHVAAYAVALLTVSGCVLSWLLSGSVTALLGTAYGAGLLAKVLGVSGLFGLAALNKWRSVPALRSGNPGAATALRWSIAVEMAAVAAILLATATITSVTTPPARL